MESAFGGGILDVFIRIAQDFENLFDSQIVKIIGKQLCGYPFEKSAELGFTKVQALGNRFKR